MFFSGVRPAMCRNPTPAAWAISVKTTFAPGGGNGAAGEAGRTRSGASSERPAAAARKLKAGLVLTDGLQRLERLALFIRFGLIPHFPVEHRQVEMGVSQLRIERHRLLQRGE